MEQAQPKSRRGRPPGSSRYSKPDAAILDRIAEAMSRDPNLKPTTAARGQGVIAESALRRLQRKWRTNGTRLLVEAARRDEPRAETLISDARMPHAREFVTTYDSSSIVARQIAQIIADLARPNPRLDAIRLALGAARDQPQRAAMMRSIAAAQQKFDLMARAIGNARNQSALERGIGDAMRAQKHVGLAITAGAYKADRGR